MSNASWDNEEVEFLSTRAARMMLEVLERDELLTPDQMQEYYDTIYFILKKVSWWKKLFPKYFSDKLDVGGNGGTNYSLHIVRLETKKGGPQ